MKLRQYLKENGIVHKYFADKLGVKPPHLSMWISGRVKPSLKTIVMIEKETKGKVTILDWIKED